MGPQSSGKSTLMNHLFGTTFVEMNAATRRGQTTQARARMREHTPALASSGLARTRTPVAGRRRPSHAQLLQAPVAWDSTRSSPTAAARRRR